MTTLALLDFRSSMSRSQKYVRMANLATVGATR